MPDSNLRVVMNVLAIGLAPTGIGVGMLLGNWHPRIGIALIAIGGVYLWCELWTCTPIVQLVPEPMLRLLFGGFTGAIAFLIVGTSIQTTFRQITKPSIPPVSSTAPAQPSAPHGNPPSSNEMPKTRKAQSPTFESSEPNERGKLYPISRQLNVTLDKVEAWITVGNIGRYNILPTALMLDAIIPSEQYMTAKEEDELFKPRPEWMGSGPLITWENTIAPGEVLPAVHKVYPWALSLNEWKNLEDGKEVIYLVTKTVAVRDKFGRLPISETCWYATASDWQHMQKCFGHNN
jgi:hypothetical protein